MARKFASGSSQYLDASSAPVSGAPLTISCWFNADNATAQHGLLGVGSNGTQDCIVLTAYGNAAGDPVRFYIADTGAGHDATTTTGFSAGTWHHACGVMVADDDWYVLIDGGSKGTEVTSKTPGTIDRTDIGAIEYNGAMNWYASAAVAEAAIWNAALDDDEVAALAAGMSPLLVRPQSLVFYCPLIRDDDEDLVGGLSLTANGGPTIAAHPRVFYPGVVGLGVGAASAGETLSIAIVPTDASYWVQGIKIVG